MNITRATTADLPAVWDVLEQARRRLSAAGHPAWPNEITAERLPLAVERGDVYLARAVLGTPVGTITVSADGDPDFWTPRELAEPASYMSTCARADGHAGVGAALGAWAVSAAAARGDRWVRLDAGRENPGLQAYYSGQGWSHVRTVEAPGRKSGALFQRLALPRQHPFRKAPALPPRPTVVSAADPLGVLPAGTPVILTDWREGVITGVLSHGQEYGIVPEAWDHEMTTRPAVSYRVRLGDGSEPVLHEVYVTEAALVQGRPQVAA